YVDESVLTLLSKRNKAIDAVIYTKTISKQLELDIKKHNQQYPTIEVKVFTKSHDRFLILDNETIYHIGASLKDLGKNWVAFSKMELESFDMISKLGI
ncbi:MAG: ORF6N domain-containing protein, partial [Bacteroidales bacterium]|nr:ORF6N domain-containing protein [Bacteroidales bacterium]